MSRRRSSGVSSSVAWAWGACAGCAPLGDLDAYSAGANRDEPARVRVTVEPAGDTGLGGGEGAPARSAESADGGANAAAGERVPRPLERAEMDDVERAGGSTAGAAPAIVSTVPADGETGVRDDAQLVIVFGQPMDTAAVESSLSSDSLPLGGAAFAWSGDDRVLRVTLPAPLAYAEGDATQDVEPVEYDYALAGATTRDGRELPEARVSFSTLRHLSAALPAAFDPDLTGSWREDDVYGTGDCAVDGPSVCVGDSRASDNARYDAFVTFELSALSPSIAEFSDARLTLRVDRVIGNPFSDLGTLNVERVSFVEIGPAAASAPALAVVDSISPIAAEHGEATSGARASLQAGDAAAQYRLRFSTPTDGDGRRDLVLFRRAGLRLYVAYLVP